MSIVPLFALFACTTETTPDPGDTGTVATDDIGDDALDAGGDTGAARSDLRGLTINEFMAYDTDDGFADGADWIELYNGSARELDLAAARLWADDGNDQYPWIFPEGTRVASRGFIVVVCDGTNAGGDVPHASFVIGRKDGTLLLTSSDGATVDAVTYGLQPTGLTSARTVDGGAEWATGVTPTPGVSNQ